MSIQLLLTQLSALRLGAPTAKPSLATGGLTVLTPAAAHAASATYDFGYRLERSLDPDKRGPSDDSAVSDILASMCNPPMAEAVDQAPALSLADAAASGIASSTALAAQPAAAMAGSAKVAAAAAAAEAVAAATEQRALTASLRELGCRREAEAEAAAGEARDAVETERVAARRAERREGEMMAALAEAQREARCVRAAHEAEAQRLESIEAEGRRAAAAERRLQAEVEAMAQHEKRMQVHLLELEAELSQRAGLTGAADDGAASAMTVAPSTPPKATEGGGGGGGLPADDWGGWCSLAADTTPTRRLASELPPRVRQVKTAPSRGRAGGGLFR